MLSLERNGRLRPVGYLVNAVILVSCSLTLMYPLLYHAKLLELDCLFRKITGLPCPTCGYSRAIGSIIDRSFWQGFLQNPGWPVWVVLQLVLVCIAGRSILRGKQLNIPTRYLRPAIGLILLVWAGKFLIGPIYY